MVSNAQPTKSFGNAATGLGSLPKLDVNLAKEGLGLSCYLNFSFNDGSFQSIIGYRQNIKLPLAEKSVSFPVSTEKMLQAISHTRVGEILVKEFRKKKIKIVLSDEKLGKGELAQFNIKTKIIYLDPYARFGNLLASLVHEIVHANDFSQAQKRLTKVEAQLEHLDESRNSFARSLERNILFSNPATIRANINLEEKKTQQQLSEIVRQSDRNRYVRELAAFKKEREFQLELKRNLPCYSKFLEDYKHEPFSSDDLTVFNEIELENLVIEIYGIEKFYVKDLLTRTPKSSSPSRLNSRSAARAQ